METKQTGETAHGASAAKPGRGARRRARMFAAIMALGGLVIAGSFLLLEWERFDEITGAGEIYETTNPGRDVMAENEDGEQVEAYLYATTLVAAGLALLPFLTSLASVGRPLLVISLVAALAALAWIVYSNSFFDKYEVETAYGVSVAWAGAAVIVLAGIATAVSTRARRV